MTTYTLTLLDTTGIQGYIFGSNVLRENVGASELVRRATRQWPFELLREGWRSNVQRDGELRGEMAELNPDLHIEKPEHELQAEVLYAGGGNCAVLFDNRDGARAFVTALGKRLLACAPGLEVVATHVPIEWTWDGAISTGEPLSLKLKEAGARMVRAKMARCTSVPLLGLGVTAACSSTGLPAVGTDPEDTKRPLSADILAKVKVWREASDYLDALLPQFRLAGLEVPRDFDDFGREEGDISYIAVVHADGNSLGQRLDALSREYEQPAQNRDYVSALRAFCEAVEGTARQALADISTLLTQRWDPEHDTISGLPLVDEEKGREVSTGAVRMAEGDRGRFCVPFRPLVFGGDDLTFVSDGRLGLPLAVAYLRAFETAAQEQAAVQEIDAVRRVLDLQACAGVAVVKTHYPFARAYELADGLCRSAKEGWERRISALDWHFAAAGLFGTVDEIRERHYRVPDPQGRGPDMRLETRPLSLAKQPGEWRSWPRLAGVLETFLANSKWRGRRNKVIALRQALREGPGAVESFRRAYGLPELPEMDSGVAALQTGGWDGAGRCGYFDAVEALDFYLPLEHENGGS
jgi:hypothetical protein